MPKEYAKNPDDFPVYETLQRIKDNLLDPKLLSKATRQMCVEVLILEGYQPFAIASLMKKSDRTIRRDVEEVRQKNALKASPELTQMLIGELIANARNHYARLKQIAREGGASTREKIQAEFMAWRIYDDLVDKLRSVGFLLPAHCQADIANPCKKKDEQPEMSEKDREIEKQYLLLRPMDRQILIEKLHRDIINLTEEKAREEEGGKEESPPDNKAIQ